ncbi:Cytohesin-4 [Astathelohania contejeani]|uniref:Cytohesin-4 n=1 Tax=Astathelohania contejeani TaxID=164912 RepID=A0ABQ7I258_9MICR|nr:Cytohesin-4 [Thelohania contejeani]
MNNKHITLLSIKLGDIKNKEINKIIEQLKSSGTLNATFDSLLSIKKYSNDDITRVLDTLTLFLESGINIDTDPMLEKILSLKFSRFDTNLDDAILSFFTLLSKMQCSANNPEIFYKFYLGLMEKITKRTILKEIFKLFVCFLKNNSHLIGLFVRKKLYTEFPFLTEFIIYFHSQLSEEERVELSIHIYKQNGNPSLLELLVGETYYIYYIYFKMKNKNLMMENALTFLVYKFDKIPFYEELSGKYFKKRIKECLDVNSEINEVDVSNNIDDRIKLIDAIRMRDKVENLIMGFNSTGNINPLVELLNSKRSVIILLRYSPLTNLTTLGKLISKENNEDLLEIFLSTFNFIGMDILDALRQLLVTFVLPGESQVIVRILENFSMAVGGKQNYKPFYILSYSLIMLNTNLHNPNVRVKMDKDAFIDGNRKCHLGSEFTDEYLGNLYDSIKEFPIEYPSNNTINISNYKLLAELENIFKYEFDSFNKAEALRFVLSRNFYLLNYSCMHDFIKVAKKLKMKMVLGYVLYYIFDRIKKGNNDHELFYDTFYEYSAMSDISPEYPVKLSENISIIKEKYDKPTQLAILLLGHLPKDQKAIRVQFIRNSSNMFEIIIQDLVDLKNHFNESTFNNLFFDILNRNCFIISKVLKNKKIASLIFKGGNKFYALLEKIIEFGLKDEFIFLVKNAEGNKTQLVCNIITEHEDFVDSEVLPTLLDSMDDSYLSFKNILYLQKKFDLFERLVKMERKMCNINKHDEEKIKEEDGVLNDNIIYEYSIHEYFKEICKNKINIFEFANSSSSVLNNSKVEGYFRNAARPGATECPCTYSLFQPETMDTRLYYLIWKADELQSTELRKYTLWIINLISVSLPLLVRFLNRNFGLLLNIKSQYLKESIVKILCSRIKKSMDGERVCIGNCNIYIWPELNILVSMMMEYKVDCGMLDFYKYDL